MKELSEAKKIYMIGIKGAGMSALAQLLKKGEKKKVSGSDVGEIFFTDELLKKAKIKVYDLFSAENIKKEKPDLIIYSTAYSKDNSELAFAIQNKIKFISYPEALGQLMKEKYAIAVCGTHGKTTVSAMLTLAMMENSKDPSAIIGSEVGQLGANSLIGKSQYFVVEADEYQDKLRYYNPSVVILTNVSYDHPDFFKTKEDYRRAFVKFVKKIPTYGFLVVCGRDAGALDVAREARCKVIIYGDFSQAEKTEILESFERTNFDIVETPLYLKLQIPGKHNLLNATAVLAFSKQFKLDYKKTVRALEDFQGTSRRFEVRGTCNGALIIDDYAHHPEEIKTTLKAARAKYPLKNIICVFQPHTFSRTAAFFEDFTQSFDDCDEVVLADIYNSAREKKGGISSEDLLNGIKRYKKEASYISDTDKIYTYLKNKIKSKDVVVIMGAGNINEVASKLVEKDGRQH